MKTGHRRFHYKVILAVFHLMIPVLKHKGGVHPKTEGECRNHLNFVDPACDSLGKEFMIVKAHNYWGEKI